MKKQTLRAKPKLFHRKTLLKKRSLLVRIILSLFQIIFSVFKAIYNFIFLLFKKKPRALTVFCITLLGSILFFIIANKINIYSENLLPTSVNIEVSNPKIYNLIHDEISKSIYYANKSKENRSLFLKRINHILFSYDQIDQYWIRLGFDRKLQISVTLQIPLLILETKGGERYVISSTSKIIAKNPVPSEYPSLYILSVPEIKVYWKPKAAQQRNNLLHPHDFKPYTTSKESINIPWLVNQTRMIYSNFQELGLNYFLTKTTWSSTTGFQLLLTAQNNNSLPTTRNLENNILILIGKENLVGKVKKIPSILNDLSQKGLHPTEIDLNYSDKASFKISTVSNFLPAKIFN